MAATPPDENVTGAPTDASAAPASPAARRAGATARRASVHALPTGHRLHEFELTEHIGEGGFSIVYRAWDQSLERVIAVKEYMPGSLATRDEDTRVYVRDEDMQDTFDAGLRSFVNESKLLASFDHPSLVKVYRFWEANGTAYMVMPFYEGLTLRDTVQAMPGRPSQEWILEVLEPLVEALTYIHHRSCFHRDIAPDNILMLADSGRPLLLDFGAARRVITDLSQALTVIVKAGYAPIEQYGAMPDSAQGPWTDVHALAAVIHWMVTGEKPPAAISRVLRETYVPLAERQPPGYTLDFLRAIDRGLALRPEDRTQSIEALAEQLGLHPSSGVSTAPRTRAPAAAPVTRPGGDSPYPPTQLHAAPVDELPAEPVDAPDDDATLMHPSGGVSAPVPPPAPAPDPTPVAPPVEEPRRPATAVAPALAIAPVAPLPPPAPVDAPLPPSAPVAAPLPPPPPVAATVPTAAPRPVAPTQHDDTEDDEDGPPALPLASGPARSALPWILGGGIAVAVAAAGAWFALRAPAPAVTSPAPVVTSPAPPPVVVPQPAPAPIEAAPPPAPVPAPAATPAEPPAPAPVPLTVPAPAPTPAPATARPVPPKEKRAAPAVNANAAECARILQRLSLGESSADLMERAASLHCK